MVAFSCRHKHRNAVDNGSVDVFPFQAQPSSLAEAMILDTEAAVIANFEFLSQTDVDMDDDDDMSDDLEPPDDDDQDDVKTTKRKGKVITSSMLSS
jgi:hypothetical protein